jgi:undecaprenyl-diphosphatase
MPIYQVVVLAIVQALTEFLPVSSTAHLALVPWLFGWKDPGLTFDIALHAGTLVAILIYFFRDWTQIIGQAFGFDVGNNPELKHNRGLLWLLAAASIPIGVLGYIFNKQAEVAWRTPYVIGTMMIAVGIVMGIAERTSTGSKALDEIDWGDGLWIGLGQVLSIVPGTSRSGITITVGLFRGLGRETAARFSFLLSTPAIGAAVLKKLWDLHKEGGIPPDMRVPFVVGTLVSGLLGALVIEFFLRFIKKSSLMPFVYYRIALGIVVILLAMFFHFTAE